MAPKRLFIPGTGLLLLSPAFLAAYSSGPPPRVTGAPGDAPQACASCHSPGLNSGSGQIQILMDTLTYSPGVTQHITVRVSDPTQSRWGFQLSARLDSDPANAQAGSLQPTDANTQVICDSGAPGPCASSVVQFIEHTLAGTRQGQKDGADFQFDWTPPATSAGSITLYAAGNAANGNGSPTGDHIYLTQVHLTAAAQAPSNLPSIKDNGVVNSAGFQTTIAPNSWVTLFGSNLSSATHIWTADEIPNGQLPTSLSGVSVSINGKQAYVEFVSPTQLNVLAPDDTSAGPVKVIVTSPAGTSAAFTAQVAALSPAFFLYDGKYLAATHADNSAIGNPGLFAGNPGATTPAKPGETVILYGTGFGPTDPAIVPGRLQTTIANCTGDLKISIGGLPATVQFAGLIPGYSGLYQFNVVVPEALGDGDQPVVSSVQGISSPFGSNCCFLTVQH